MKRLSATVVLTLLLLSYCCRLISACVGLGGCGFGGCCLGHFCARARGTKSLKVPYDEEKGEGVRLQSLQNVGMMEADFSNRIRDENEEFLECCREHNLPDACLAKCSYVSYNQHTLRSMFLRVDPCPLLAANDIHFCAARGRDHRQCCVMNGVTTTLAQKKCLIFCDQRPQNETSLDLSYLPCFERFESIKGCFWRWARKQYQLQKISAKDETLLEVKMRPVPNLQPETELSPPPPPAPPFDDYR